MIRPLALTLVVLGSSGCSLLGFFDATPADCEGAACSDGDADSDSDPDAGCVDPSDRDCDGWPDDEDCADDYPDWHPGAIDILGDGYDTNCDGTDGVDSDGDGYASEGSGGDDCDDADDQIHPGAEDSYGDGDDQNCDGEDGDVTCPGIDDGTCGDELGCNELRFCCNGSLLGGPENPITCGKGGVSRRELCDPSCGPWQFCCDRVCREWWELCAVDENGYCAEPCDDPLVCVSGACGCPPDDADCDGWTACAVVGDEDCDCDDENPAINPGALDDPRWTVETIDDTGLANTHSSLAFDADDQAHVSYLWTEAELTRWLRYSSRPAGGDWASSAAVDSSVVSDTETSLSLDGGGTPSIAYSGQLERVLIAYPDGEGWAFVDPGLSSPARSAALVHDGDGDRHVVFFVLDEQTTTLQHAYAGGDGAWTEEAIVPELAEPTGSISLAIDSGSYLHVCYVLAGLLHYATNVSDSWDVDDFGDVPAGFCSIGLDADGAVHLLADDGDGRLHHRWLDGVRWVDEPLDVGDASADAGSLAIDPIDPETKLHIAYHDITSNVLRYASNRSGAWRFETAHQIDGDDTGLDPSIAMDSRGGVGVVFANASGDLLFAYRDPPDGDQNCDGYDE